MLFNYVDEQDRTAGQEFGKWQENAQHAQKGNAFGPPTPTAFYMALWVAVEECQSLSS